jgi:hypothetical protein
MKITRTVLIAIILLGIGTSTYSAESHDPNEGAPLSIEYFRDAIRNRGDYRFQRELVRDSVAAGDYGYNFGIGSPSQFDIIQAGILWDRRLLELTWWCDSHATNRVWCCALFYCLDRIEIDTFHPPRPERFAALEAKARRAELIFVLENIDWFYERLHEIFRDTLDADHERTQLLAKKINKRAILNGTVLSESSGFSTVRDFPVF